MKKYRIIIFLSAIALVNAAYLSYKAYFFRYIDPQGLTSFCDFSSFNSCSEVLRHPLSSVFGIPFPWVALAVYPILLGLAWYGYKHQSYTQAKALAILSFMGMCFNGFIIYREIFFIKAFCLRIESERKNMEMMISVQIKHRRQKALIKKISR